MCGGADVTCFGQRVDVEYMATMPRKAIPDDAVTIKGTIDGVNVIVDEKYDLVRLFSKLEQKIKSAKSFFSGNQIMVSLKERAFTKDEFDYFRSSLKLKYGVDVAPLIPVQGEEEKPKVEEDKLFKTGPQLCNTKVISHTLRAGQSVEYEGDIVIAGDVNPGAEVVATGNVFVMGAVRGRVCAGCKGNRESYIIAMDFEPVQLRIADKVAVSPSAQGLKRELRTQKAFIEGDSIVVVSVR
ncbi:MAG: septum site-determining protein MinC [Caldisericales bacterium]